MVLAQTMTAGQPQFLNSADYHLLKACIESNIREDGAAPAVGGTNFLLDDEGNYLLDDNGNRLLAF